MGDLVFTIYLKFSMSFISLNFWVIHQNKTNSSLESDYSIFIFFSFFR